MRANGGDRGVRPAGKFTHIGNATLGRMAARLSWQGLISALLWAALALLAARLFWALVTPLGPAGAPATLPAQPNAAAREAMLRAYDPFFPAPAAEGGMIAVTPLALRLHGVRVNEGSGQGSAIIAGPDGVQTSYAVGEAVQPGVILKAVSFDHVVIDRNGREEWLFLDQSTPAPPATLLPSVPAPTTPALAVPPAPTIAAPQGAPR